MEVGESSSKGITNSKMEPNTPEIDGSLAEETPRFRGGHLTQVDEKFRLKIPADFKRLIDEVYGPKFYVTSEDGVRAQIYPMKEWLKIEAKLAKIPTKNAGRQKFLRTTSYFGRVVEMDAQGRILLPQLLRDEANLTEEVTVLGMLTYLEVTKHSTSKTEARGMTEADDAALAEFGF
jgi:MraZ protein